MLEKIIQYSIHHKLIVLLFTLGVIGFGTYSLFNIPIGAVPDITNNQVQVITTSRNLATQDVEKFLTYPVELEMANLPGVIEIRSVSKFGLSVVTIVFEDKMGTYLPRQLIAEKLKTAEEKIPAAFGVPFMGPISTGLGEIYQYTLEVEDEYKDQYTIMELRTIQDWVVKRQLSGIPGVVEVNTWGGHLKQYEVAVNPERLRSLNLSISEVFAAIEKNNSVAGGGYIEKTNETFFIRGEGLVSSLEDIENILVESRDGTPILVKNVAEVGFGKANRFGAITGNGEGEKVLGQIMMLKDANSKAVIEAVKQRVSEIENSLPKGIYINGFLERSELIGKTTFTIAENLILGCLIVIFVVVLLLGNFRSGLVVASVIPLSLLFALSLMYIFGVDANLMSLGAIDFGIIIDGAVIIVEFIAFKITSERSKILELPKEERQNLINKITFQGATKMMRSAVFGQLIIIIVFIPILSLVDVEGKMFRPMALVFCFALIGAMLMCFTYVPVVASMFLKPTDPNKKTISSRLIHFLEEKYSPTIIWALRSKKLVLGMAITLLIGVGILFSTMGGEFVPTLDEGDFVIQPVLKTGTTLSKTIETTTRIEKILKTFPEVDQVVSRIGAAEVPTDPMSMEESDVIIKLKPKSEWTSAESKDELAEKFKSALSEIPGIEYEFTQPIEMRFNELITGVRADLAIKIFGEDLDILYKKGQEVQKAIQGVEGAVDIIVEKITGLPQMSVQFDRQKIAKYGLNIEDLNNVITTGFAGKTAGIVFEGEKQFDLVVRFDENHRKDIDNIETASVLLPNGSKLPLSEFATISYSKGPAKISRDDTKRRIVVGVNVRNRDLESVVKDVQTIIERDIELPTGYSITYGGQFQNLRSAKARLAIAVPIALILIFILLYFAFNSVKEALIIYSAIPMAAVGGVLLLYIRGMPFSISAGVGFIALFGIAVLNGIVLIDHFKELKAQGIHDINKRIIMGTRDRLRPVLLTAAAAALGFLPMAISTSAGAEVQRPLATVVVGGLISATALTLIVLPVLYAIFDRKGHHPKLKPGKASFLLIFLIGIPFLGNSQEKPLSVEQAIQISLENNKGLRASAARVQQNEQLIGTAFNIDKTQVYYQYDESNRAENNQPLKVWGLSQSLQFPTIYGAQRKVQKGKAALSQQQFALDSRFITREVSKAYYR
ncbi:MAG: CusA/CzcA family heavy metal efflux RND transporter, partial [Bacteroidota bacterium]